MNLDTDQLDLFILHAHSTVCHYQKELAKLQTLEKQKLNAAIEIARHGNPEMLSEFEIESAVNREKDYLRSEFEKKVRMNGVRVDFVPNDFCVVFVVEERCRERTAEAA